MDPVINEACLIITGVIIFTPMNYLYYLVSFISFVKQEETIKPRIKKKKTPDEIYSAHRH